MKRYLLLFAAIMIAATAALADATSVVILQHKGNKTMFAPDSIQVAVSQAVDGDTILLSRGQFPEVTINKSITLRGDGRVTGIKKLTIDGGERVISPSILSLCCDYYTNNGEWVSSDIVLRNNTEGLKVIDCKFYTMQPTGNHKNISFRRCLSYYDVYVNKALVSGTFENCKFTNLYFRDNPHSDFVFLNSTMPFISLGTSNNDFTQCVFINSVLLCSGKFNGSSLINCLIFKNSSTDATYYENCWFDSGSWNGSALDNDWLSEKGYLGNDGTPIGYLGGQHPYDSSLSAGVPRVANSKVLLDTEKGTLDVEVEFEY